MQWLFRTEGTRLARYESRVFDYFDACTIISQNDRLLIQHRDRDRIELIPNGVDLERVFPTGQESAPRSDPKCILFTGNMSYAPNVDAAHHLVEDILPLDSAPGVRVVLAGAQPKASVQGPGKRPRDRHGMGGRHRRRCTEATLFVAPLRIGTGLQNKVLEAMAPELPCVFSPHAFRAAQFAEHRARRGVPRCAQAFADGHRRLLNNPGQGTWPRRAAASIEASFAWKHPCNDPWPTSGRRGVHEIRLRFPNLSLQLPRHEKPTSIRRPPRFCGWHSHARPQPLHPRHR